SPKPEPPPVTIATLPAKRITASLHLYRRSLARVAGNEKSDADIEDRAARPVNGHVAGRGGCGRKRLSRSRLGPYGRRICLYRRGGLGGRICLYRRCGFCRPHRTNLLQQLELGVRKRTGRRRKSHAREPARTW